MTITLIVLLWLVVGLCALCVWLDIRYRRVEKELFDSHNELDWCLTDKRQLEVQNDYLETTVSKLRKR